TGGVPHRQGQQGALRRVCARGHGTPQLRCGPCCCQVRRWLMQEQVASSSWDGSPEPSASYGRLGRAVPHRNVCPTCVSLCEESRGCFANLRTLPRSPRPGTV